MHILALDTATNCGGVAVSRNEELIGQVLLKTPLRYSETLIPMIDFLLTQLELELSDIGLLAAAAGPGSFTGLRVGLATAKALGQANDIPAVGISTLEALAYRFRNHEIPRIAALIDARRQQVFAALYGLDEKGGLETLGEAVARRPREWLETLETDRNSLFVGDGARQYRGAIRAVFPEARILETDNRLLESLCLLGYRKRVAGEALPVDQLKAIYVRSPDVRN